MPVSPRECKFAAMRIISEQVDLARRCELKLRAPYGTIALGGADFEFLLKATVGEAYIRILRRGGTPNEAHAEAIKDGNECVKQWNEKTHKTRMSINGRHELKRWGQEGESIADHIHCHYLNLLKK